MAMNDFSLAIIQGHLVETPEGSTTAGGSNRCRFTVAVNRRINKEGEEATAFIPVTVFGGEAESCAKYLTKGRGVRVQGELETSSYTDTEGVRRKGFSLVVAPGNHGHVTFLSGGSRQDGESNPISTERDPDPEDDAGDSVDLSHLSPEQRSAVLRLVQGSKAKTTRR